MQQAQSRMLPHAKGETEFQWYADNFSRALHLHNYSEGEALKDAIIKLCFKCKIQPRDVTVKTLEAIILDLFARYETSKGESCIGVFTSNGKKTDKDSEQYKRLGVVGSALRRYLEKLEEADLVQVHQGTYNPSKGRGYSTKVRAKPALIEYLKEAGICLEKFRYRRINSIVWRDDEKQSHAPAEEIALKAGSDVLERYNQLLQLSDVRVGNDALWPWEKGIRRIFRDKDCTSDGRHSGGIWQTLSGEARAKIRINGLEVSEIDIKSTHPLIAYALMNKDLTMMAVTGFDPYHLKELNGLNPKPIRKLLKTIVLMMFSSTKLNVKQAVQAEINKSPSLSKTWRALKDKGFGLDRLIDLLNRKHIFIQKFFFTESWKTFNFYESNVAQRVIEYFTNKGILVLSVYDSFIVQKQYQEELKQVLAKALADELTTLFSSKEKLSSIKNEDSFTDTEAEAELLRVRIYRDKFND